MNATIVLGTLRLGGTVIQLAGAEWEVLTSVGGVRSTVVILDEDCVL